MGGRKGSAPKAGKCCVCNGPHARSKSCACVKAGRSCSSCHPLRLDRCSNSHSNLSAPTSTTSCSQPSVLSDIAVECESQCFSQPTPPFRQSTQPPPQPLPPQPPPAVPPPAPDHESVSSDIYLNQPRLPSGPLPPTNDHKEPCIVAGCRERIAPTMSLHHLSLHAKGILCGDVPSDWLHKHARFICSELVSISHRSSHQSKCIQSSLQSNINSLPLVRGVPSTHMQASLPTLQDICSLRCPTIRFIPSRARPSFARVLSAVLRDVVAENSIEAWTKLFMLPKCLLPSSKRGGRHNKPIPIESLCDMWLGGNLSELWSFAQNRAASSSHSNKTTRVRPNDGVTSSISLSKDGLYGKACRLLVSQGVAPNNESTWNLLVSKHLKGGCPVGLPGAPNDGTLPPDFNLGPVLRSFPKLTGAGPSGLRIQHLLDAVEVPLQTPILHSLKAVVNILSSGRAPALISPFLAGGNLTAFVKSKDSCASDIRPIAVGETLRHLTAKCLCAVVKAKAAEFFQPHQFGISCFMGAEKIAHGLRACVNRQWKDEGFSVLKLDMRNAFNVVSRQAFLSECSLHFPELYPWVLWCYGQHPILWHPMGTLTSECGVQQGDPLGPLLFCLVLNILVKDICSELNCANVSFHSWYLDDGVVAGPSLAVQKVLALIEEKGPPLGLLVNFSKCEVFSPTDVNLFRGELIRSSSPNIVILGVPIGDLEFCSNYISNKCASAKLLLHKLDKVGAQDAQVALVLLRLCGSFCKLAHLARATPPSLSIKALELFDIDVRHCFSQCTAVDTSDEAWLQAQLSLSRGGLGLRSLSSHAAAAYIASLCSSDFSSLSSLHLTSAIGKFNSSVSPSDVVSVESFAQRPPIQKALSAKIDDFQFNQLFNSSSLADRARLLSISSPHASSWLSVVPSEGLGLHLNPDQFQVAIKWWLGLDTSGGSLCSLCPDTVLDPLGHHASTCKRGGDAVFRHNRLRDVVAESCRWPT